MTKTRGRPFKPGQSGNPAGRPSNSNCLTACLRELADKPHKHGQTQAQALAAIVWRRALAGDLRAAVLVYDRVEGKPGQRLEVEATGQTQTSVSFVGCGSLSEWAAKMHTHDIPRAEAAAESGGTRQ